MTTNRSIASNRRGVVVAPNPAVLSELGLNRSFRSTTTTNENNHRTLGGGGGGGAASIITTTSTTTTTTTTTTTKQRNWRVVKRWSKTIYKVMLVRIKIKCYETLVRLGVRVNLAGVNVAEISYFATDWKDIRKFNLEMFQSEDACKHFRKFDNEPNELMV